MAELSTPPSGTIFWSATHPQTAQSAVVRGRWWFDARAAAAIDDVLGAPQDQIICVPYCGAPPARFFDCATKKWVTA